MHHNYLQVWKFVNNNLGTATTLTAPKNVFHHSRGFFNFMVLSLIFAFAFSLYIVLNIISYIIYSKKEYKRNYEVVLIEQIFRTNYRWTLNEWEYDIEFAYFIYDKNKDAFKIELTTNKIKTSLEFSESYNKFLSKVENCKKEIEKTKIIDLQKINKLYNE